MLDDAAAAAWLRDAWAAALCGGAAEDPDPHIDAVQNSRLVSVRYALVTQLLGKHADGRRDALCLQRGEPEGATEAGRWDPRSFCSTVVVPWVQSTNHVLGTSSDPYVSNPLRRSRLDDWSIPLRDRAEWERLVTILAEVQGRDDAEYTETVLRGCLASIARRYAVLDVPYPVPNRVSLSQTLTGITSFLATASGGERALIVVTALMRVVGREFGLFERVDRQGINESDAATGAPGDVLCYRNEGDRERLALTVEVKDRDVTLLDLNATIEKARQASVSEVLFAVTGPQPSEASKMDSRIHEEWVQGTNIYYMTILELARAVLTLAGEDSRPSFLREVGQEINRAAAQPILRTAWADVLRTIG